MKFKINYLEMQKGSALSVDEQSITPPVVSSINSLSFVNNYISGDKILNEISLIKFFNIEYFNKYIKNFVANNNLITYKKNENKNSPLIFITKIEYLDNFYNQIVKSLNTKFVLITHYGDKEAGLHNKILKHPLLIKWYGQNMRIISDKTLPIPIGLEEYLMDLSSNITKFTIS